MTVFPKFDTKKILAESECSPAKVAKPAKVTTQIPQDTQTLATLATLATLSPDPVKTVSGCPEQEVPVCGQCAIIVKESQEFLHVVAGGFPGVIHLDCYDAWFDAHIRERYPD